MQTDDSFTLEFPAVPPRILWALAADTNRVSRAIGLVPGDFSTEPAEPDAGGKTSQSLQVGHANQLGFPVEWVTGPDSWVEGAWYRTIRRYRRGPAREAVIEYRIEAGDFPGQPGSRIVVTRRTTGSLVAVLFDKLLVGGRLRSYLQQAVEVAARCVSGIARSQPATIEVARAFAQLPPGLVTGSAAPTNLTELGVRRAGLAGSSGGTSDQALDQALLDKLADYLSHQPDEAVADLSPVRFAEWAERPLREVLRLFLLATRAGILELRWSLRCQSCRASAATVASLEDLPGEVKCPGCGGAFGPDLATHVEAAFAIHQGLRRASIQRYCTAGAALRPHVFAQLVATPEAPCEITAPLLDGPLTVRVLGLSEPQAFPRRPASLQVTIRGDRVAVEAVGEAKGATQISVRCEGRTTPAVVLIERLDWGETWVSAAQLATVPEFHALFGGQAPRTRHEVSVGTLTLLFSDLRGSTALYQRIGDPRAFTLVSDHFDRLKEVIEANEGALIKTMGDAVMAVFQSPPTALRAALAMQRAVADSATAEAGLVLKLGVHVGNCLAVRANGRLDLFGHNVNLAARTQAQSHGGDIVVTDAVLAHPDVGPLLQDVTRESFEVTLKGIDGAQRLWRLHPSAPPS